LQPQIVNNKETLYIRFEVFTAVTMKNGVLWDVTSCDLVRTDVSEEIDISSQLASFASYD
jgi:hypothetical protein